MVSPTIRRSVPRSWAREIRSTPPADGSAPHFGASRPRCGRGASAEWGRLDARMTTRCMGPLNVSDGIRSSTAAIASGAGAIALQDGVVDLHAGRVIRNGVESHLTANEQRLLGHLVDAEARPVARAELLTEVFGYAAQSSSRTLESTISRLRAKLEVNPREPFHIVNVYGRGYRFVAAR